MPIRTLFALLFLFSAPSWSGTPEQPEVLSNAAPPSIAARMPAKATLIKRAGHAPLLAKTAKGEDIVFEYLPDGRLHAIRAPWREK